MADRLRVLHLDGGRRWAGGQNQVRLLMRGLGDRGEAQLCVCPRGSGLHRRLRDEGLPVRGVDWRGPADPRAAWAVARALVDRRPPDLIHCHEAHALQVALVPAFLRGIPVVASRRIHFPASPLKWNRARRVIAISAVVARSLGESGVDLWRVRVVHSGVDPEELRTLPAPDPPLRTLLGLGPDAFLVGSIGHLDPCKGQEVIPRAAALAPEEVHWVVVGEGPERERLDGLVARNRVEKRVHLPGRIQDARRILSELDLFAFPSVDDALGTSLLDAMATGVPAVAACALGPAEILEPVHRKVGGMLFPPGDAPALARSVERLWTDPALRRRVSEAQVARAGEFTARAMVQGTVEVYRELLA